MAARGFSEFVLFDTSQYNNNHVQTLNTWQAFCNDTTVWQRNDKGHYYALECDDPSTCKLARQAADQRNARSNAEERLGEHTDALVELMRYNKEIREQQEEIKRNREELEIRAARVEAAQKGLATKRRNKEKRDEQKRLTEHICAELESLKGHDEQQNERLAGLQRDVLRAAKKKEKEKIAKKNQLVSRICDALDNLKVLDEKNKERFKRI
ncbi:hypothetical protein D6D18_08171 [Aureobasidium pullulans]|nr:hypothetical protein D6D26_09906 [Aureobasidium pullulans]THW83282.1 hypothetical protein D6D18_08171 [Aureobasidium pullulans]